MSEAASERALVVWDALLASRQAQLGAITCTEVMKASGLARVEVVAGIQELLAGGWVERRVITRDRQVLETWLPVERQPGRGVRGQRQMDAAE
jgi:hypothetical protein